MTDLASCVGISPFCLLGSRTGRWEGGTVQAEDRYWVIMVRGERGDVPGAGSRNVAGKH